MTNKNRRRIDYFQRCDLTYAKVHSSKTRKMWNGLIVNREDYDKKPPIFNLRVARHIDIVPNNARADRPLTEYTPQTPKELERDYKQYNP